MEGEHMAETILTFGNSAAKLKCTTSASLYIVHQISTALIWQSIFSNQIEHRLLSLWSASPSTSNTLLRMQYFSVPHRFLQDSKDSWGFLRMPEDSSGLHYNLSDCELEENNSVKSSGIPRTGTEFGRISAKLEYSTSLLGRGHVT